MNTHSEYHRHDHPLQDQTLVHRRPAGAADEVERSAEPAAPSPAIPDPARPRIAWIRPTEMGAYLAPILGQGVDLQAGLIRGARRAPVTATRRLQQAVRQPDGSATPVAPSTATRTEGIQL